MARFSAANNVQAKDCIHLNCRHTSRRGRVSSAVKAAMLLQRDCALAAMGRRLRYENSTTMRQRGAGKLYVATHSLSRSSERHLCKSPIIARQQQDRGAAARQQRSLAIIARLQLGAAARQRRFEARPSRERACDAVAPPRDRFTVARQERSSSIVTGPLRDGTLLTQLCDRGATVTRFQRTELSGTTSKLRGSTTAGLRRGSTTTRLLRGCVAAVQLCDRGAAATRPKRKSVVATHCSSAVATQHSSVVATQCNSAVATQRSSDVATQLVLQCCGDAARQCCGDAVW
jgi:hypothetical protein